MTRLRLLVWLVALVAFAVPAIGPASTGHAMASAMMQEGQAASADCPEHAPPPEDCPAGGTAKHAAGQCCPLMAGSLAVLPPAAIAGVPPSVSPAVAAAARHLSGLDFAKDPPPPRV